MRKIAILKVDGDYISNYDQVILNSITDWKEVTDVEYSALISWCGKKGFTILEQINAKQEQHIKCVDDAIKFAKIEQDRLDVEKANRLAKQQAIAIKREQAKIKRLQKLIEKDSVLIQSLLAKNSQ